MKLAAENPLFIYAGTKLEVRALAFSFVLSSHFFSNSECSSVCNVVLNVFVVLPLREIDWPHALQIANFASSPTLK